MKNNKLQNMLHFFQIGLLFVMLSVAVVQVNAQVCNHIPVGGGQTFTSWIVERDTGTPISNGATVSPSTWIKIHSRATADGQCLQRVQIENVCTLTGTVWERVINHTGVKVFITSVGSLNGEYSLGSVFGKNPNGTTAFLHVLDTTQADSTGPKTFLLPYEGTYTFKQRAVINITPCNMTPDRVNAEWEEITINVSGSEEEASVSRQLHKRNADLFGEGWSWLFNESTGVYKNLLRGIV